MNEEEMLALVDRARDAEGTPSTPPPGLLEGARRRARRRRLVVSATAGLGVVAAVVATAAVPGLLGGGADPLLAVPADGRTDAPVDPPPDELRLTCTDTGPQVESTTVAAAPAGVVVVARSTMGRGAYLTYASDGPDGGDEIVVGAAPTAYAFPPGVVTLGCAAPPGMDETGTVEVEVVDPGGFWRTTTLADFGCHEGGAQPSWIAVSGAGPTAREAVDALLADFADALDRDTDDYTADPAPTGYAGADRQTWVAAVRGTPEFSVVVTRDGTGYTAGPESLCQHS